MGGRWSFSGTCFHSESHATTHECFISDLPVFLLLSFSWTQTTIIFKPNNMRSLTSLPLDDDIIDRIMTFLPTFSALSATILASKHFYAIFKVHSNSIIRSVAYNITGPALYQAMRVIRYTPKQPDLQHSGTSTQTSTWVETDPVSPITAEEAILLNENAVVVKALEDLFSSRQVSLPFY